MTYLVYLNHYNIRQCKAQYLDMFYNVLESELDVHFLLNQEYIDKYNIGNRWEVRKVESDWGKYENLLKKITPDKYTLLKKPEEWENNKNLSVPSQILSNTVYGHHEEEIEAINKALKKNKIEAGITWVNNWTFKSTLEKSNIPTIHHELGPFRETAYTSTMYMDFSGINGDTEFDKRFQEFLKVSNEVPILSREELIRIISPSNWQKLVNILHENRRMYDIGVGLQVEVDTNLLIYNKGCNWIDPILQAISESKTRVLVRPHPCAAYNLSQRWEMVIDDPTKSSAVDFINKCNKIYCLNSSVAIEALLLGREARIFGDSPFKNLCSMEEDTLLKALNFTIFGYLISKDFLYNNEYYKFRLKNIGNEKLIYLHNMKYLLEKSKH